jgi:alginate O-acetyltransferase complex protein AlgI
LVGLWLARAARPRLVLAVGVAFNLGVLAWYKYTPLVLATLGVPLADPSAWEVPYGISFYGFTGVAYMVDVYRRTAAAEASPWRYTLSATFFPHLVAGPILRASEFLDRLRPGEMPTGPEAPAEACWLLACGYFKKLVLADRLSAAADPFFAHVADPTTAGVWSLPYVYLYALQIYFDFSAYTDIARGLGLLFGYRWPDNFDRPYLSASVAEFWHRWHVTLSRFLRDYLYIPLGGSRCGWWRTNLNLMVTMLLGGLWHGASWSFLLWGGLHGGFLVAHRAWCGLPLRGRLAALTGPAGWLWRVACVALTFHCVCLAWVFFRLTDFPEALTCLGKAVAFEPGRAWVGGVADPSLWAALGVYLVLTAAGERARAGWGTAGDFRRGFGWALGPGLLALAALLSPGNKPPAFIYFQF